jgi:CRISPR/Cas system-associated endonuclease Cas1
MVLPEQPVTLTAEQIAALNHELGNMRHDINNNLSLVLAAVELIRAKPHMAERMIATILEQPGKISQSMQQFSREFEKAYGIKRH